MTSALEEAGLEAREIESVVVGTTIGINAVLTRRGARVLYLTTKGFEDIPYIQRINRKHHYDFHWRKPSPLVRRRDCLGVGERLDEEGRVLTPLDLDALEATLDAVDLDGAAVAVCLLFAYLNPEHEVRVRDAIHARLPGLPVSLSHEVAPIWREYERGTTVTVDAFTKPLFETYVKRPLAGAPGRRRRRDVVGAEVERRTRARVGGSLAARAPAPVRHRRRGHRRRLRGPCGPGRSRFGF